MRTIRVRMIIYAKAIKFELYHDLIGRIKQLKK